MNRDMRQMDGRRWITAGCCALALLAGTAGAAITSAWTNNAGGYWTNSANWNNGVPTNAGDTAYFTNAITADRYVTVDVNVTVGTLKIGSAANAWHIGDTSTNIIIMDSGNASRAVLQGLGGVQNYGPAKMAMNVDLEINGNASGPYFRMTSLSLSGSHDVYFNANGLAGVPYLSSSSPYIGNSYICTGTIMPSGDFFGAITGGVRTITFTNNATCKLNGYMNPVATNRVYVIGTGGGQFNLNGYTLAMPGKGQLTGSNTLTVNSTGGSGTFLIGGTNDGYTGQVVLNSGITMRLNTNGWINFVPVINVNHTGCVFSVTNKTAGYTLPAGQVLAGIGTNQGIFKVASSSATLHPGTYALPGPVTAPGVMMVDGGLTFTNGGVYAWDLKLLKDDATTNASTGTFSAITSVSGAVKLDGGVLAINFNGVSAPSITNTFWKSSHTWTVLTAATPPSGMLAVSNGVSSGWVFRTQVSGNNLQLVYTFIPQSTMLMVR